MYKMLNWKFVVRVAVVILAFCVGVFLYARWDVQRFTESLGEPPPPVVPSQREAVTEKVPEQVSPTPALEITSVSGDLQTHEENSIPLTLDIETTDPEAKELSDAELDALLETFEQQALSTLREAVDAEDEKFDDNTELVDAIEEQYGPSPEIDVVAEAMKRIDEGTTTLDNLIEMMEASSTIMPENMPEGTMSFLEMLRSAKSYGGLIVTTNAEGDTTFLVGPSGEMMDSLNSGNMTLEFHGDDGRKMDLNLEDATLIK